MKYILTKQLFFKVHMPKFLDEVNVLTSTVNQELDLEQKFKKCYDFNFIEYCQIVNESQKIVHAHTHTQVRACVLTYGVP